MLEKKSIVEDRPTVKVRVRKNFVLHLWREGQRKEVYREDEITWLTQAEVKQYQHLIDVVND